MNHLGIRVAAAMLVAFAFVGGLPGSGVVDAAGVTVSVSCNSNPERATLTNNRSSGLTINSVGSTYAQCSDEPFYVYKHLAAHSSITYQSGTNATHHVLTHQFIYNNDTRDGVRFKTSIGKFVKHC